MATKSSKTESIRTVALDVIDNYQRAAKSATASVRAGSAKSIAKVDSTVGELLKYEGKISKKVKNSLGETQDKLVSATEAADQAAGKLTKKVKGKLVDAREKVAKATTKADTAVDKLVTKAAKKVSGFAGKGTRLGKLLDNNVVATVEPLGIKGAKVLRYVSSTLADGVEKLSNKIGAKEVKKATPAVKKAAPAKKPAVKAAAPKAKPAVKKAPAKAPVKSAVVRKAPVRRAKAAVAAAPVAPAAV